jgi:hypothetical protein
MEVKEKIHSLFKTIDEMNADKFVTYLTDDAQFRFGNSPVVKGKLAIRDAVDGFYKSIKSLFHNCENLWINGDHIIYQGKVTYTRLDGNIVPVQFTNIFGMKGDLIKDYFIYIDITALYAPM